ncbi:MAG: hypothetical protein NW216_15220 [Hyphomicrobium sp.]|nr:hypothetical protein [Hyphomicrobium sp.]
MLKRLTLAAAIVLVALVPTHADDVDAPHPLASDPEIGARFSPDTAIETAQLRVGCLDHRSLMRIVAEIEGDDPDLARLLAGRDCRPLIPDAVYIRCGAGGYAYPAKGDRLTFSLYCRTNAADAQLYTLDQLMRPATDAP